VSARRCLVRQLLSVSRLRHDHLPAQPDWATSCTWGCLALHRVCRSHVRQHLRASAGICVLSVDHVGLCPVARRHRNVRNRVVLRCARVSRRRVVLRRSRSAKVNPTALQASCFHISPAHRAASPRFASCRFNRIAMPARDSARRDRVARIRTRTWTSPSKSAGYRSTSATQPTTRTTSFRPKSSTGSPWHARRRQTSGPLPLRWSPSRIYRRYRGMGMI
jgi:hypothetical protein